MNRIHPQIQNQQQEAFNTSTNLNQEYEQNEDRLQISENEYYLQQLQICHQITNDLQDFLLNIYQNTNQIRNQQLSFSNLVLEYIDKSLDIVDEKIKKDDEELRQKLSAAQKFCYLNLNGRQIMRQIVYGKEILFENQDDIQFSSQLFRLSASEFLAKYSFDKNEIDKKKYPFLKLVDTEQNFQIVWSLQDIFEKQKSQNELEYIKQEEYDSFTIDTTQIKKGTTISLDFNCQIDQFGYNSQGQSEFKDYFQDYSINQVQNEQKDESQVIKYHADIDYPIEISEKQEEQKQIQDFQQNQSYNRCNSQNYDQEQYKGENYQQNQSLELDFGDDQNQDQFSGYQQEQLQSSQCLYQETHQYEFKTEEQQEMALQTILENMEKNNNNDQNQQQQISFSYFLKEYIDKSLDIIENKIQQQNEKLYEVLDQAKIFCYLNLNGRKIMRQIFLYKKLMFEKQADIFLAIEFSNMSQSQFQAHYSLYEDKSLLDNLFGIFTRYVQKDMISIINTLNYLKQNNNDRSIQYLHNKIRCNKEYPLFGIDYEFDDMEQFYSSNNKYLLLREKKYPFLKLVDTEQNFQIVWSLQDIFEKQKSQRELEQIKLEEYDTFTIDTIQIKKGQK
ncbi:hypothetical protein PPERSA_12743 [Pseudocohnilembus persalinus]|uniref:Uncharacterized protein n=1 Tax=Pseudocohnilembus persalinus TaxID=266149 RepID=A0A0V0QTS5_PSEPJ|nr:hypothetical protein PPERSA_12743 [Pseudocohnilembus persalinus]|eukprot:KRX05565.1 hypothetical protein PPERSA_12743 [Pseudocohnilembus persalinus]